jgi:ABC-2 type transport system permease protein
MLWYKAWRESRSRFLIAVAAVTVFSVGVLLGARTNFPPPQAPMLPYSAFVWGEFYGNWRAVVFSMIALLLGLGGLQRERASGSAPFTLALPITRGRLSPLLARHAYPWSQSLQYAALFMSWGIVWFAIACLWSALFRGEFTAAVAAILTPFAYMVLYGASSGDQRFPGANPFAMMSGGLDRHLGGRMLLTEPLPWVAMLVLAAIAAALVCGAWRVTVRQNF